MMVMLNDVYSRRILELAADIPHFGRLPHPDASATARSKLCGSVVTVDLKTSGCVVTAIACDVKACVLGQASSAIMSHYAVGSTGDELRAVRDCMSRMLKGQGAPPTGKWAELDVFEPARELKARHTSILLVFNAVVDALDQVDEAKFCNLTQIDNGSGARSILRR
jgi:NifU-like protein involved in Fe-S cluster formation